MKNLSKQYRVQAAATLMSFRSYPEHLLARIYTAAVLSWRFCGPPTDRKHIAPLPL